MATDLFKSFTNPISKETFRTISFDKDKYSMEWNLQPEGYVPFEHVHYHQEETFHVKKGELRVVIDGKEYIASAGQSITVPIAASHIAYNNKKESLEATVDYTPGLDYENFMKCFIGLMADGYIDKAGGVNIPMMGYMIKRMKLEALTRPTNIPAAAFGMSLYVFYMMGVVSGWGKLYDKYSK